VAESEALARMRAELTSGRMPRLAKPTSNLFRSRAPAGTRLDAAAFAGVRSVDPVTRTADVGGLTTYEDLVDATLPLGLMPLVVPQLKTITLGGAVSGLGIESSSFRAGMPHESVLAMDVLTGAGEVVRVEPDGEHEQLFRAFPNSYGTLGYALRLQIELQPVRPYVRLEHRTFSSAKELALEVERVCEDPAVDFVDGSVFSADEMYLTLGSFVDAAPYTSDYVRDVYYRSIRWRREDFLAVRDYLWRWDTDWFWCSRVFGVQQPLVRRLVPRRYLRSDTYWRLIALDRRYGVSRRLDRWRSRPPREAVIQDVEVPVQALPEFLDFFHAHIGIAPIWLCPLRQRRPDVVWDLYRLDPATTYVNVGFWSTVPLPEGEKEGYHNRLIEQEVERLGGRKSLYSTSYYPEDEFWRLYGGATYRAVKQRYDPDDVLLDLYQKCVQRR
jgi:FAD/FMN-containing dehydrogenase